MRIFHTLCECFKGVSEKLHHNISPFMQNFVIILKNIAEMVGIFEEKDFLYFLELKEIYRHFFEEFLDRFWELCILAYFEILIKLCSIYDMISI